MTVAGFIGSGHIGRTVARLSVAAGHQVVLSNSRGPATLAGLVAELGPLARAATGEEAAAAGDIVVVAIPERDGHFAVLDDGLETSSELLQSHLPGAQVVKVFNTIFYKRLLSLSRPSGAADRSFLPTAGDDPAAMSSARVYLDSIGYGAVDAGNLAESWRQQPGTPVSGAPYGSVTDEAGTPASEEAIREALSKADR